MKIMQWVLFPMLALMVLASPAAAQTDVTPVVNQLIDWLAVVLMAGSGVVIAAVLRWLASKTKLQDNEFEALLSGRLNDILHRAIEHAVVVAKNEVNKSGSGLKELKFDNVFLNIALNFAISRMPDIINYFELDDNAIRDMIMARINAWSEEVPLDGGASEPQTVQAARVALSPAI